MIEYFNSLDTLRFFAFLCVFISHIFIFLQIPANPYLFTQGNLAVFFFFVLSSFLITYILLKKDFSIKTFYEKRILRIWPVYYLVVIIAFFIIPPLIHSSLFSHIASSKIQAITAGTTWSRFPWFLLFLSNYGVFVGGAILPVYLGILWSISIEEQYYLVWPWIVKKVKRDKLPWVFIGLIIICALYRILFPADTNSIPAIISYFATGGYGAYLATYDVRVKTFFKSRSTYFAAVLILLLPVLFYINKYIELRTLQTGSLFMTVIFSLLSQILALYFITAILYSAFNTHILIGIWMRRPFEYLGRISYGLYCYHSFGILIVKIFFTFIHRENFLIEALLSLALTILITAISYKYIEKPILKYKSRLETTSIKKA